MIQIDVEVPDRPGELAKLAAILGDAGINIDAIGAESAGGRSYVSLIVNEEMPSRPRRPAYARGDRSSAFRSRTARPRPGPLRNPHGRSAEESRPGAAQEDLRPR